MEFQSQKLSGHSFHDWHGSGHGSSNVFLSPQTSDGLGLSIEIDALFQ